MPITLREQVQAIEAARAVLLGGPKPRRSEAEEVANQLEEAADTIRKLASASRDPWKATT